MLFHNIVAPLPANFAGRGGGGFLPACHSSPAKRERNPLQTFGLTARNNKGISRRSDPRNSSKRHIDLLEIVSRADHVDSRRATEPFPIQRFNRSTIFYSPKLQFLNLHFHFIIPPIQTHLPSAGFIEYSTSSCGTIEHVVVFLAVGRPGFDYRRLVSGPDEWLELRFLAKKARQRVRRMKLPPPARIEI